MTNDRVPDYNVPKDVEDDVDRQIAEKKAQIEDLKRKIALFDEYITNPHKINRTGIYSRNGNNANNDLKEVFDLTREKYQDNIVFVSVHVNSTADEQQTGASGIRVYYRVNDSTSNQNYYLNYNEAARYDFSKTLLNELNKITNFSKKSYEPYKSDLSVLRENNLISALIEVGFINNPNDLQMLVTEQTKEDVAAGIYKGVVKFFQK